jgi:dissimilatory sulfite reductase (desulfoviridin) alpha/beta subunit
MAENVSRYYYIYKITNLLNNMIYIGGHCSSNLNNQYFGSGTRLKHAIKKYGIKNFKKEILEVFDNESDMWKKEHEIVNEDFLKKSDVYNLVIGGRAGWTLSNKIIQEKNKNNPNYYIEKKKKISVGVKNAIKNGKGNTSTEHMIYLTEKSKLPEYIKKRKETYKKINHQQGENHILFGKKIVHKDDFGWMWTKNYLEMLSQGWKLGKGNFQKGKE